MKLKLVMLLGLTGFLGGCAATVTPRGDVYTELLVPSAVVVERRPPMAFVPVHRQHTHQHRGHLVAGRHWGFNPRPGMRPKGPVRFR